MKRNRVWMWGLRLIIFFSSMYTTKLHMLGEERWPMIGMPDSLITPLLISIST